MSRLFKKFASVSFRYLKKFFILVFVFLWLFADYFPNWQNLRIPLKIKETKAANYLTNPSFTGGTVGWTLSGSASYDANIYQDTPGSLKIEAVGMEKIAQGAAEQTISATINSYDTVFLSLYWRKECSGGQCGFNFIKVQIARPSDPNTWITIWSDNKIPRIRTINWIQVSLDVSSYFTETGQYKIRLYAYLQSGNYQFARASAWFDNLALDVITPTFDQSAYRWFKNLDSTDVGLPLADQNTPATLSSPGMAFRLRLLLHIDTTYLKTNGAQFKLQFAQRGLDGICDSLFIGEAYENVTSATAIAYYDNPTPIDGQALIANFNDPTHQLDTVVNQTYEEVNNFINLQGTINAGQDGKWDFALKDNGAPVGTTYCFRVVKNDGSLLNSYSVIPEITTAQPTSLSCTLSSTSTVFSNLSPTGVYTSSPDIDITITSSGGFQITIKDYGNGTNPGLYKSSDPTYLIQSQDTTLTAGSDGYGIQATTTASSIYINPKYNKSGNDIGGLSLTEIQLASSTTAINNGIITIKHKASVSYLAPAGSYSDTITYTCSPL